MIIIRIKGLVADRKHGRSRSRSRSRSYSRSRSRY
ncbi:hypothetical protein SAMN05421756_10233 [Microlunatus flavus]|uniref:Uncharacterized protein n=1 Tax=Microlunatus flavus TaxID=1036181 RepID=A0A1H9C0P6_9ACTN|nr:hypothetical protein SAMN05421756_10233 [Microlunatus flavus]